MTGTDHHIAGLGNLVEWSKSSAQAAGKGKVVSTEPQRGMLSRPQLAVLVLIVYRHAGI